MGLPARGSAYFGNPQWPGAENTGETVHRDTGMLYHRAIRDEGLFMIVHGKVSGTVIGIAAALVWLQLYPQSASAQGRGIDRERGSIYLGMFITDRNTTARVDPSNGGGGGTDVDLEGDLGLDSSTSVGRFGGYFWITHRQ